MNMLVMYYHYHRSYVPQEIDSSYNGSDETVVNSLQQKSDAFAASQTEEGGLAIVHLYHR